MVYNNIKTQVAHSICEYLSKPIYLQLLVIFFNAISSNSTKILNVKKKKKKKETGINYTNMWLEYSVSVCEWWLIYKNNEREWTKLWNSTLSICWTLNVFWEKGKSWHAGVNHIIILEFTPVLLRDALSTPFVFLKIK